MILRTLMLPLLFAAVCTPAFSSTNTAQENTEYFEILEGSITDKDFDVIQKIGACYKNHINQLSDSSPDTREIIDQSMGRFKDEEEKAQKEIHDLEDKKEILKVYDSLIGLLSTYKRTAYQVLINTEKGKKYLNLVTAKHPSAKNDSDLAFALLLGLEDRKAMKTCLMDAGKLIGSTNTTQTAQLHKEIDKPIEILSDPVAYSKKIGAKKSVAPKRAIKKAKSALKDFKKSLGFGSKKK